MDRPAITDTDQANTTKAPPDTKSARQIAAIRLLRLLLGYDISHTLLTLYESRTQPQQQQPPQSGTWRRGYGPASLHLSAESPGGSPIAPWQPGKGAPQPKQPPKPPPQQRNAQSGPRSSQSDGSSQGGSNIAPWRPGPQEPPSDGKTPGDTDISQQDKLDDTQQIISPADQQPTQDTVPPIYIVVSDPYKGSIISAQPKAPETNYITLTNFPYRITADANYFYILTYKTSPYYQLEVYDHTWNHVTTWTADLPLGDITQSQDSIFIAAETAIYQYTKQGAYWAYSPSTECTHNSGICASPSLLYNLVHIYNNVYIHNFGLQSINLFPLTDNAQALEYYDSKIYKCGYPTDQLARYTMTGTGKEVSQILPVQPQGLCIINEFMYLVLTEDRKIIWYPLSYFAWT